MGINITGFNFSQNEISYFTGQVCPVFTTNNTLMESAAVAGLRNKTRFSVGLWVKVASQPASTGMTLWVSRQGDNATSWLHVMSDMKLRMTAFQSTGNNLYVVTDNQIPINIWTHIGVSFDGSLSDENKVKIFNCGSQKATIIASQAGTVTATQNIGNAYYRIGMYATAGNYAMAGNAQLCALLIDDVWTAEDWQTWYAGGLGADVTRCTHKWALTDNADTIVDSVGGVNLTYSGAGKAWVNHF